MQQKRGKIMQEVRVTGDKDLFEILYKVENEATGITHEASAMYIENMGCVVRTRTLIGKSATSESTVFVPNTIVVTNGNGNKLEEL